MIYRNKLNYDDIGGDKRDRTADLLRARQALSQLSYIPNHILWFSLIHSTLIRLLLALNRQHNLSNHRSKWWVWVDLNHRPHPYQGCALTTWATDPIGFIFDTFILLLFTIISQTVWTLKVNSIFGKEVIQPQVPLRLPCYDFTPVMNHTVVNALPKVKLSTSGTTHSHGVTGGVYKARERIHRDILIRDY